MLDYIYSSAIEEKLRSGIYKEVFKKDGTPLGHVRDAATGQFVANSDAIGIANSSGLPFQPFVTPLSAISLSESNTLPILQSLSGSIGTLQATMSVIGVGVAVTGVISAVNLWQTVKLRRDVAELRGEMRDGFLDLRQLLSTQNRDVIEHIGRVASDVEFAHHRTILIRAHGQFNHAVRRVRSTVSMQDVNQRSAEITSIRNTMSESLADYNNAQLITQVSAPGYLRRRECAWAIEQAIALTYYLQSESQVAAEYLTDLCERIKKDILSAVKLITTEEELEFLFAEIKRIYDHDLPLLNHWSSQMQWTSEQTPQDQKMLRASSQHSLIAVSDQDSIQLGANEMQSYRLLQERSHFAAIRDQLQLMMCADLRYRYTQDIVQEARKQGMDGINCENLVDASLETITNLYYLYYNSKPT